MPRSRPVKQAATIEMAPDLPLLGVVLLQDGLERVRYFTDAEDADAQASSSDAQRALGLLGAWADLDWEDTQRELDTIRHDTSPTPPIDEL